MQQEAIFSIVKEHVLSILVDLDPDSVTMDRSLKELGANSIDRVEVTMAAMEDLNLRIHPGEFQDVKNLRSLVETLHRHLVAV